MIPLEPLRRVSRGGNDAIRKLDIDRLPQVAKLAARARQLQQGLDLLNRESRRRDFATFTDHQQFLDYDRVPHQLAEVEKQFRLLDRQLDALRLAKAIDGMSGLDRTNRPRLTAYADAVAAIKKAETRAYPY